MMINLRGSHIHSHIVQLQNQKSKQRSCTSFFLAKPCSTFWPLLTVQEFLRSSRWPQFSGSVPHAHHAHEILLLLLLLACLLGSLPAAAAACPLLPLASVLLLLLWLPPRL
jgi:hypothetical protein